MRRRWSKGQITDRLSLAWRGLVTAQDVKLTSAATRSLSDFGHDF